MAAITAQQLNELANEFIGMAQAVGNYRFRNFVTLSAEENKQLGDLQWNLLNTANNLFTASAIAVMDEVEDALDKIKAVSKDMATTYKNLKTIQDAIDVATAAVTLGAAIFSNSPVAIIGAIDGLVKAIPHDK